MIEITNEAFTKLDSKANQGKGTAFRIGLTGGGCSGYKYTFDWASSTSSDDFQLDLGRFKIVIDKISAPYLTGMTLDYVYEGLNEEFRFINPNQAYACGCGESIGFGNI